MLRDGSALQRRSRGVVVLIVCRVAALGLASGDLLPSSRFVLSPGGLPEPGRVRSLERIGQSRDTEEEEFVERWLVGVS